MFDTFSVAKRNKRGYISQIVGGRMRRYSPFSGEMTIETIDPFNGLDMHRVARDEGAILVDFADLRGPTRGVGLRSSIDELSIDLELALR